MKYLSKPNAKSLMFITGQRYFFKNATVKSA